jgi:hypothetical protein
VAPELARGGLAASAPSGAKERFTRLAMDAFSIDATEGGRTVGIFVGQPWDWSTYYLRHLALLPEARGFGAVVGVVELFSEVLGRYGIERLELDVSISHRAQLARILGCGFHPMGTLHSERWGAMVHLVRFLAPSHERVFLDRFSAGLRTQARRGARPADSASGTRPTTEV